MPKLSEPRVNVLTVMPAPDANAAFMSLGPDQILDAVESTGRVADGSLLALASYENRVYRVGLVDEAPVVVKFYRPGRWSDEQILEEHDFCLRLVEAELPVIAPLRTAGDETLIHHGPYRMAFYALRPGRPPAFDNADHREMLGRFAARLHNVGALGRFTARPILSPQSHGHASLAYLTSADVIPAELRAPYESVAVHALERVEALFEACAPLHTLRIHGDLHAGNILWTDDGPLVMDFDDCGTGPAIADLWMFLSGDEDYRQACLEDLVTGYEQFRDFPYEQLPLVESLRTLRVMHHSAWLARRWSDPAFPRAFPWFDSPRYWQDQILTLREQISAMEEAPLRRAL